MVNWNVKKVSREHIWNLECFKILVNAESYN